MKLKIEADRKAVRLLLSAAQTLSKLSSHCCIYFAQTSIELRSIGAVNGYCRIPVTSNLFPLFKIESKSDNCIALLLHLKSLSAALKASDFTQDITIKLSKTEHRDIFSGKTTLKPCLELSILNKQAVTISITKLLSITAADEYAEPKLPSPEVTLHMPKNIKALLDKTKLLQKNCCLTLTKDCLRLTVTNETVNFESTFHGLGIDTEENENTATCTLKIADFLSVLQYSSYVSRAERELICVVQGRVLVVFVSLEDESAYFTFYVPTASSVQ